MATNNSVDTINIQVGARLKGARLQAVLTQDELARELDVDRTTITRWEAGQRSLTVVNLLRAASVLGRSPLDLLLPPPAGTIPPTTLSQEVKTIIRRLEQYPDLVSVVLELVQQRLQTEHSATDDPSAT